MKIKTFRQFAVSGLCLAAAAVPSFAAEFSKVKINVPFAFKAGNVTLPAGDYVVAEETPAGVILIEGRKGSTMFLAGPERETVAGMPQMTFQRTGQGAVLTEIRLGAASRSVPAAR
jgi:hypothetical protein